MSRWTWLVIAYIGMILMGAVALVVALGWIVSAACGAEFSPHYEHAWIEKHRNRHGQMCCNRSDCFVLTPALVIELPQGGGYSLQEYHGEIVPREDVLASEDGKFYRCQWPDGRRRCFFAPFGAS